MGRTARPITARLDPAQQALAATHVAVADRMARRVAARYPRLRDELGCAARLGLVEAALSYRDRAGVAFVAYARHRIRGSMIEACREALTGGLRPVRSAGLERPVTVTLAGDLEGDGGAGVAAVDAADAFEHLVGRLANVDHRRILTLIYVGGLRQNEVARLMGRAESTISAAESRSLARLRARLESPAEEPPYGHVPT